MRELNFIDHHKGIVVPIATPLTPERHLDESALLRLINHVIDGQVDGIFVLGTTGEAASLSFETKCRIIEQSTKAVQDRVRLYVGISDTCVAEVVRLEGFCSNLGIKTVVVHPPYFYSLEYHELHAYFQQILDSATCDVMLYNMPALTKIDIPLELVEKLSTHPKVVGLKESSKDMDRLTRLISIFSKRTDFAVFVGVSAYALKALRLGSAGCVPSIANLSPSLCTQLYHAHISGDTSRADELDNRLQKINDILQPNRNTNTGLAKLKAGLEILGLCSRHTAPPLLPVTDEQLERISGELGDCNVYPRAI